jgi:uncharacterized protein YdiU (UPF0061 family)
MSRAAPTTLTSLRFDNRALRELPLDPEPRNFVRGRVAGAAFSRVEPAPLAGARLVVAAPEALALLGVADAGAELARADAADLLCGNARLPGSEPAAHCYCGHQFGHFSGQLGDGATMYLGECLSEGNAGGAAGGVGGAGGASGADASASAPGGVVPARWELQFKGAGRTPYSRTADGRKVLRSSLREFLCSEAHAALGIATTRSASVVVGDTRVVRDEFYSGRPREERCAVITRIAPTFLRFGSFEVCRTLDPTTGRAGPSVGRTDLLRRLLAFTCRSYFPEIYAAHPTRAPAATAEAAASGGAAPAPAPAPAPVGDGVIADEEAPERYLAMFREVCLRTARLCAQWQVLGWCHGVLNTDNMSIVGVTVDYGRVEWRKAREPPRPAPRVCVCVTCLLLSLRPRARDNFLPR